MPVTPTRAARLVAHGEPLRVETVALPAPGADEVLVDLQFAGVNPIDRYNALGRVSPDGPVPRTLGGEGSALLDGALVVVTGAGLGSTRDGLFASAAVVPRATCVPVPAGVSPQVAAAVGVAGVTAYHVVEQGGIGPGDRVLVLGAGGGVGLPAVSYAASRGATVWGQIGTAGKAAAVRAAGAAEVVVSDAAGLVASVAGLAPTVVIDPIAGPFVAAAVEALPARGRYVVFGTSAGADVSLNWQSVYRKGLRITGYGGLTLTPAERRAGVENALAALARGDMTMPIHRTYPLDRVNDAFAELAGRGVTGKVLLDLR